MTINTKYNLGDVIYLMGSNKVLCEYIINIFIKTTKDHKGNVVTEIRYETNSSTCVNENVVFSTKEELLATL